MQGVNISIDAFDQRAFEEEYWAWEKSRPRAPGALGYYAPMPPMNGPSPEGRCYYISVPESFLEVLQAKAIPFRRSP